VRFAKHECAKKALLYHGAQLDGVEWIV